MIMPVSFKVSRMVCMSVALFNRPMPATIAIAPSAPREAASVGAATPPMIEPSTETTSSTGGTTVLITLSHSSRRGIASRSAFGIGGACCGTSRPRMIR